MNQQYLRDSATLDAPSFGGGTKGSLQNKATSLPGANYMAASYTGSSNIANQPQGRTL